MIDLIKEIAYIVGTGMAWALCISPLVIALLTNPPDD
jgi:hypothetical protein